MFSVKSAYHCQWNQKYGDRNIVVVSGGTSSSSVWKELWKLSIPSKIKIFAWRVLHGCIPCLTILANKHISNTGNCPMCQTGAEDIKHALFSCNRAREVWGALGIWDVIEKLLSIDRSGSVLIQEIIGRRGLATG